MFIIATSFTVFINKSQFLCTSPWIFTMFFVCYSREKIDQNLNWLPLFTFLLSATSLSVSVKHRLSEFIFVVDLHEFRCVQLFHFPQKCAKKTIWIQICFVIVSNTDNETRHKGVVWKRKVRTMAMERAINKAAFNFRLLDSSFFWYSHKRYSETVFKGSIELSATWTALVNIALSGAD